MNNWQQAIENFNTCIFLMETYNDEQFVNVGTGTDITIKGLAETIQKVVGISGEITFDTSKPNGTPRKISALR